MPTSNNRKYLPPGYEEELRKNNPPTWVTRFLDVSFEAFEGQIFPEYDENLHTCLIDDLDLPPFWDYAPGFDFGVTAPTACLFGCYNRQEDMLYVYDELYIPDAEVIRFAGKMKAKGYNWSWADPSVDYKGANKETPSMLYAKEGVTLIGAKNDENTFFKALIDRIRQGKIMIARDKCPNLNEQIKAAAWAPKTITGELSVEKAKAGLRYPNHALDALKYMMNGLGLWGQQPDSKVARHDDIDEDEYEDKGFSNMRPVRPRRCR